MRYAVAVLVLMLSVLCISSAQAQRYVPPPGQKVTPITVWIMTSPAWQMCRTTDPSNPVIAGTCEDCCHYHFDNGDLTPGSGPTGVEVCLLHCRTLPPVRYHTCIFVVHDGWLIT